MAMELPIDQDEVLKKLASESIKHGENIRAHVRDLTLRALQSRETSLTQIGLVLKAMTEGIDLGTQNPGIDAGQAVSEALGGMDDALGKAVEANRIALAQLAEASGDFESSPIKKAMDDLQSYEDTFLTAIRTAAQGATGNMKGPWDDALQRFNAGGTDTGNQVAATMEEYGRRVQTALRDSRTAGAKVANALLQNYATLVSGVLMGLSEALQQEDGSKKAAPRKGRK
jgi:hypothetical protein